MNAGIYSLGERRLVTAGDDFYIAPGAQVIGSVVLGAGASLWFNCVLRADDERIDIGSGSTFSIVTAYAHGIPLQILTGGPVYNPSGNPSYGMILVGKNSPLKLTLEYQASRVGTYLPSSAVRHRSNT